MGGLGQVPFCEVRGKGEGVVYALCVLLGNFEIQSFSYCPLTVELTRLVPLQSFYCWSDLTESEPGWLGEYLVSQGGCSHSPTWNNSTSHSLVCENEIHSDFDYSFGTHSQG